MMPLGPSQWKRTSNSKRSLLVRYFGLNVEARSLLLEFPPRPSGAVPVSFCSLVLVEVPVFRTDLNITIVSSNPPLNDAKLSGSQSFKGWLKLCCSDQKMGYSASGSLGFVAGVDILASNETPFADGESFTGFGSSIGFGVLAVPEVPFVSSWLAGTSESTCIASGDLGRDDSSSKMVTLST